MISFWTVSELGSSNSFVAFVLIEDASCFAVSSSVMVSALLLSASATAILMISSFFSLMNLSSVVACSISAFGWDVIFSIFWLAVDNSFAVDCCSE